MSNKAEIKSQKESFADWLWKKNKINENNGVKAQGFHNEIFICLAMFFGYMWYTGSYTFEFRIGEDRSLFGSFLLYLFVVYLVSCLFSWLVSLLIDCLYGNQIVKVAGNYPRKRKFTCY